MSSRLLLFLAVAFVLACCLEAQWGHPGYYGGGPWGYRPYWRRPFYGGYGPYGGYRPYGPYGGYRPWGGYGWG